MSYVHRSESNLIEEIQYSQKILQEQKLKN